MALGRLAEFFKDHPWRNYVIVNLVLVALEKLVEQDFVCPCRRGYTEGFFFLYLMMPLLLTLNFGVYMWNSNLWSGSEGQCGCERSRRCCGKFLTCAVPSVFWLVLFFGDGRFVACVKTQLKKDHVDTIALPPWEWCDRNRTLTAEQNDVQESFYISKVVVFSIISIIFLGVLLYQLCKSCSVEQPTAQPPDEHNGPPSGEPTEGSNGPPSGEPTEGSNGPPSGEPTEGSNGPPSGEPTEGSNAPLSHNSTAQSEERTGVPSNAMVLKTFSSNP
ncbi:hypothetical protein MHYP_G00219020 [Metynnis hypsauchen]